MSQSGMTSRERVLAAIRREPVDHVPFLANYNPLSAPQRRGYRWQFPWGPSQREQCEYCVNELGTDTRVHVDIPCENPEPGVCSKVWFDDGVIHKVWTTPSGELSASVKYDERWSHGLDIPFRSDFLLGHSLKHWVKSERDVACLKHIVRPPQDLDRVRFGYQEAKRLANRLQDSPP